MIADMSKRLLPLAILVTLVPIVSSADSGDVAWKRLLSLAGEWEGTEGGRTTTLTYTVISGGSALMESMRMPAPEPDMVTVYHPDGDRLVMTHYCSAGNQPRMATEPIKGDTGNLHFAFLDATNLAAPGDGHMHDLVVTSVDQNHFDEEWTWQAGGKDKKEVFHWVRAR